jgi:hypothetical protein
VTVVVNFCKARGIDGAYAAPELSEIRKRENITIPATTSNAIEDGEVVIIYNGEANPIAVAFGTAPDADATSSTSSTSAGLAIAANGSISLYPPNGSTINVKSMS